MLPAWDGLAGSAAGRGTRWRSHVRPHQAFQREPAVVAAVLRSEAPYPDNLPRVDERFTEHLFRDDLIQHQERDIARPRVDLGIRTPDTACPFTLRWVGMNVDLLARHRLTAVLGQRQWVRDHHAALEEFAVRSGPTAQI